MSELRVLVRRGGQQYQIRPAAVNAPSGERTPAFGFTEGENSWTQPPLTAKAAALVDQLLQADGEDRRRALRYLAAAYPRSLRMQA